MHAYDKCGLVWEREVKPDHIQWGWCTKPRGHDGQHGHASEDHEPRGRERTMIARLTVEYGNGLTEYPLAERTRGGWQNGVRFYADEHVTNVKPMLLIPVPHVPFGPAGVPELVADATYMDHAASNLEGKFEVGGSNVRATVVRILRDVAFGLRAAHREPDHEDGAR